jgi:nucleotide-binding universal stress UspA family protein
MGYVPTGYVDKLLDDLRANGRKVLTKAEALARAGGVDAKVLLVETKGRTIADVILAQARKVRADVIVLGTHGRRGLRRVVMGSDAEAVLRDARVPVLMVRSVERAARDSGTA